MKENVMKLPIFFLSNQMQKLIVCCIAKDFIHRLSKTVILEFLEFFYIYTKRLLKKMLRYHHLKNQHPMVNWDNCRRHKQYLLPNNSTKPVSGNPHSSQQKTRRKVPFTNASHYHFFSNRTIIF